MKEAHRILYNQDKRIKNVDFIIVPAYNKDVIRFQRKGDTDCLEGNYPYIVQVNSLSIQGARAGGTCVIGTEHKDAVARYKDLGLLSKNVSEYKLIETDKESIIVIDLDIKRKGVPVPATGPKMKVLQKYIYENGRWNSVDF